MDITRDVITKIEEMAAPKTYEINGETYSSGRLSRIHPVYDSPSELHVSSLESIVKLVAKEHESINQTIFVHVDNYESVSVFTTYNERFERFDLYQARFDAPRPGFGWKDYENAMIAFRSQFIPNVGVNYLLDILSRITDDNSVSSNDNGMTQTVEARSGISLKTKEKINPRVKLRPYRTFLEVEQPESEFLVRLKEGGQIGLFEADGGMWKLEAKSNIRAYFEKELAALIESGRVIVMA